jgi:phosphoesterase RecJ-like protein
MYQRLNEFSQLLYDKINTKLDDFDKIIIISHENTDYDGVAAVLALKYLIQSFICQDNNKIIAFLHSNNLSASEALKSLELTNECITKFGDFHNPKDHYLIIIVDTNNFDKILEPIPKEQIREMILIDHHESLAFLKSNNEEYGQETGKNSLFFKSLLSIWYIDPQASSCAEIIAGIWQIWEQLTVSKNSKLDSNAQEKRIALLLLLGILSDSANLRYSQNSVIPNIQFLITRGADIQQVRRLSSIQITIDERIAKIKGAARVEEPILIKDSTYTWIVLFTNVNSFEAAVCRSLIDLGADIVFCLSTQKNKEFRLIVRSSERFQGSSNINFGLFMEQLGTQYQGHGGGHSGAAGMNGFNCPDNLKKIVIKKIEGDLHGKVK